MYLKNCGFYTYFCEKNWCVGTFYFYFQNFVIFPTPPPFVQATLDPDFIVFLHFIEKQKK